MKLRASRGTGDAASFAFRGSRFWEGICGKRAPFGLKTADGWQNGQVKAKLIKPDDYKADFEIAYDYWKDDFVAVHLFINQTLRPSFPIPEWTQAKCPG